MRKYCCLMSISKCRQFLRRYIIKSNAIIRGMVSLDMPSPVILAHPSFPNTVISRVPFPGKLAFGGWRRADIWKRGLMIVNNHRTDQTVSPGTGKYIGCPCLFFLI